MTDPKKNVLKEISLWKKRFADSKRVLAGTYKNFSRDAKKAYKEIVK